MSISQIEITNIKGISHQCFKLQLMAHKPNLLVAPNGFGKSSIAAAFMAMNSNRIDLADKDRHKEDESLQPELSITVDGEALTANRSKNEIRQRFDVLVINSGLIPKAKKHYRGSVSSSLEVKPITICKIPEKFDFNYKVGDFRLEFGANGKVLPNISGLLSNPLLVEAIEGIEFTKLTQIGNE